MKRFVQILNDKAHWIFTAEERPEFAPNIIILDITEVQYESVREGWHYDVVTGEFKDPYHV